MRRRLPPPTSLTSLLDVLFILIFAALIHTASTDASASAPHAVMPDAALPIDAGLDASGNLFEDRSQLREMALEQINQEIESRPQILIKVSGSAGNYLVELERSAEEWTPLAILESVEDPEIGLAYAGDRDARRGLCAQIAATVGPEALEGAIVIVSAALEPEKLPVALARGLAGESKTCAREFGGMLVTLSPKDIEP